MASIVPTNFAHRVFKIYKANAYKFNETVNLIKLEYFKDQPIDVVQKIVATHLRNPPYSILINDDGTYENPEDADDLMSVIKGEREMPSKKRSKDSEDEGESEEEESTTPSDETIGEEEVVKIVSKSSEVKKFKKKYPECNWEIDLSAPNWLVKITSDKEQLNVTVDPASQQILSAELTPITSEEEESEEGEGTPLQKIKVPSPIREPLEELGILNVEDLASANVGTADLNEVGLDPNAFDEWVVRAQCYLEKNNKTHPPTPSKAVPKEKPSSTKLPPPKSPQKDIENILSDKEKEVYAPILELESDSAPNTFGRDLANLVSSPEKKRFSTVSSDIPAPPPQPKPLPQLPSHPQTPKKQPNGSTQNEPEPPIPVSSKQDDHKLIFKLISSTLSSTRYDSVIESLKKKERPPKIY